MNARTSFLFLIFFSILTKPLFARQEMGQGEITLVPISNSLDSLGLEEKDVRAFFDGVEMSLLKQGNETYVLLAADLEKPDSSYSLRIFRDSLVVFSLEVGVRVGNFSEGLQKRPYISAKLSAEALDSISREKRPLLRALNSTSSTRFWRSSFVYPLDSIDVSSEFGRQRIYTNRTTHHRGVDFSADTGTPIKAVSEGRVLWAEDKELFLEGKMVAIDHGQGVVSIYMHLSSVAVSAGDWVERGQVIGGVGSTGSATGPHLHFSIKVGRTYVSPIQFIEVINKLVSN